MAVLGLDTVAIVVRDRHRAIAWYRDVLGLEIAYLGPNSEDADPTAQGTPDNAGHWIEMGPGRPLTRVHICELPDQVESGPTGITFITSDIRADFERMRAKGAKFLYPPKRMDWGEWLSEFEDPDGNGFDLKQPIDLAPWAP